MKLYYFNDNGKEYIVEIVEDLGEDVFIRAVISVNTNKGRKLTHRRVSKTELKPLVSAII